MSSLYEELRESNPRMFSIDRHTSVDTVDLHPCRNCVVRDSRNPEHCDPCSDNPDRERLKKAGLL